MFSGKVCESQAVTIVITRLFQTPLCRIERSWAEFARHFQKFGNESVWLLPAVAHLFG